MNYKKLKETAKNLPDILSSCTLCPHRCRVNRNKGELGFCNANDELFLYSWQLHMGEEPPISGLKGSGTLFFSNCNSRCVYCQNYVFSQCDAGKRMDTKGLTGIMLKLQEKRALNINLVTPTHYLPHIVCALKEAYDEGLVIPIVYNSNGYELEETLELLDGIVDIYLPDMRYGDNDIALKYSSMPDYVGYNRQAIKTMYQQVGDFVEVDGVAKRGLIVRHLVLPNKLAGTESVMKFINSEVSNKVFISLMSQYHPAYKASEYKEINRMITKEEYEEAVECFHDSGLSNGWLQSDITERDRDKLFGVNFNPTENEM